MLEQPEHDPRYEGPAGAFLRAAVAYRTGYTVQVDDHLAGRAMELDHDRERIGIRPGMSLRALRSAVSGAVLYITGGPTWAPDFSHHIPRLRVVHDIPEPRTDGDCGRCARDRGEGRRSG